jgi:hypothetical protein
MFTETAMEFRLLRYLSLAWVRDAKGRSVVLWSRKRYHVYILDRLAMKLEQRRIEWLVYFPGPFLTQYCWHLNTRSFQMVRCISMCRAHHHPYKSNFIHVVRGVTWPGIRGTHVFSLVGVHSMRWTTLDTTLRRRLLVSRILQISSFSSSSLI